MIKLINEEPHQSKPKGKPAEELLSDVLAWCDREEILLQLERVLKRPPGPPQLFCFADHTHNRPEKLRFRICKDLQERVQQIQCQFTHTKHDYGFEDKEGYEGMERFEKTMLEVCAVDNMATLRVQMLGAKVDAFVMWHSVDCSQWPKNKIALLLQTARCWLDQFAGGQGANWGARVILLLVLRYDVAQPGLWDKLLRRDIKTKMCSAYQQVGQARTHQSQMVLQDLLILPDYSREDFRRWLNLERVRDYLGGKLATFEDEDLLAQHFAKGSSHYEALRKFVEQHQKD